MSRIITMAELQNRPMVYLQKLHHQMQQDLAESAVGSEDRRTALASLENISRAMAHARMLPRPRL
ncbi:MAG TPA: hypothetical protein VLE70_11020 [Anaerolineae bacterium]|nr:hypothetical protein [Anaerolineae bacterium]